MQQLRSGVLAALMLAAISASGAAQTPSDRDLARRWDRARGDSASLAALFRESVRHDGAALVAAVQRTAADRRRAPVARVYAIATLYGWLQPADWNRAGAFLWAGRDATRPCLPHRSWSEGDTLRICARIGSTWEYPAVGEGTPPPPFPARPATVDSAAVLALLRRIAAGEPSTPAAGAADLLLAHFRGAPRAPVFACSEPPADAAGTRRTLLNPCEVQRRLTRSYPPLLRDAGTEGLSVISLRIAPDGRVLEARVARPGGRPELDQTSLRLAEYMRFSPAAATAADQQIELAIAWLGSTEYPRVAAN